MKVVINDRFGGFGLPVERALTQPVQKRKKRR